MFSNSNNRFAIDLGNNNTLVTNDHQILLSQPSYIVFDEKKRSVKAVGDLAYDIFEKNHEQLRPVKPLQWGVIADYDSAVAMINRLVNQVCHKKWYKSYDHVLSGVPYATTEVERRALRNALDQFNPKKRNLVFEPLAAAIGMGLNIREPEGKMIIDIGGGITEIVIISLSGVAVFQSLKVAGDSFTQEIQDHFRKEHNMSIGWKTAEKIKIEAGAASSDLKEDKFKFTVKGKDMIEGIPVTRETTHHELASVLNKPISAIEQGIIQALEICPPELAGDIYQNGINLTGGSSLLKGLRSRLEKTIGLPVHLDDEPLLSVSKGISQTLRDPKKYQAILID
jgi:rod shape-determining protein MreB